MYSLGYYGSQKDSTSNFDLLSILIPIIGLYLGLRAKRNENDNILTYLQGLSTGVKISLVWAVLSSLLFLLYYVGIDKASLEYVGEAYGMKDSSVMRVLMVDLGIQLISSFIFGSLSSLFFAFLVKRES